METGVIKGDTPCAKHERETSDTADDIYMKRFCSTKDPAKEEQEKILGTPIPNKGLLSRID